MAIKNESTVEKKTVKAKSTPVIKETEEVIAPVIENKPEVNKVIRRFKNKAIGI